MKLRNTVDTFMMRRASSYFASQARQTLPGPNNLGKEQ